jgi:hypothetical protein
LQQPGENAFGEHFNAGFAAHLAFEAHPVAGRGPEGFAQQRRQARRHGPGRQPPGLQHEDLAAGQPGFVEQVDREHGALAGAGRGLQNDGVLPPQGAFHVFENFQDGKRHFNDN